MGEPTLFPESGFSRFKTLLSYDGTNYSGWAKQSDQRTVQEEVESALSTMFGREVDVVVAGRTDAGVHATGQVIHFDLPEGTDVSNLVYKANRIFDGDIRFLEVSQAAPGFHARFSALRRYYTYKIADDNQILMPLERIDIATWYRPISEKIMNEASALLLGKRDFAAFCKFRAGGSTIRTLEKFEWVRDSKGILIGTVIADAFCYQQVRNMVGAIATVAEGRHDLSWLQTMLENKERVTDSMVFPANGLTLTRVDYPGDSELLARAELTIARREIDGA